MTRKGRINSTIRRLGANQLNSPSLTSASWVVRSFGRTHHFHTPHPELIKPLRAILPPLWEASSSTTPDMTFDLFRGEWGYEVRVNGEFLQEYSTEAEAINAIENEMSFDLGEQSPDYVFVHAGVVAWQGQAIVLPGRSMAGKSTLVRALIEAGATYYSDEYAVLDQQGWVHPYPRSLSIRQNLHSWPLRVPPQELGVLVGEEPLPIGQVIFTRYQADRSEWQPRRLSPARTVLGMMEHTLTARTQPEKSLHALQKAASHAHGLTGTRGDAIRTARQLLALPTTSSLHPVPTTFPVPLPL
jgi:hypothetical protein